MRYKNYILELASYDDIKSIMAFIKNEWKENHILAVNKPFFEYEYLNEDGSVNFAIARNLDTNQIDAIHAFYILDEHKTDLFGGLWKCKNGTPPLLGVVLKKFLYDSFNYRSFSALGSNPNTTIPIQKYFKYKTGKLNHYYLLNNNKQYSIANIRKQPKLAKPAPSEGYSLKKVQDFKHLLNEVSFIENANLVPFKSESYIYKRYFNHPIYKYDLYTISHPITKTNAFVVIRKISINGSKVGRIVDYIGDESYLSNMGEAFLKLIHSQDYEYLDFYNTGINKKYLIQAGFSLRDDQDPNIIPNYFEPFVQSNIDIYYHIASDCCRICKADSDQDRPNV